MNLLLTFDNYFNMPREQAYNQFLDEKNLKIFKVILLVFALIFAILFTVNLAENQSFNLALIVTLINLTLLVSARIIYHKIFTVSNVRRYIFVFLIVQLLMLMSIDILYPEADEEEIATDKKGKKELIKTDTLKKNSPRITISSDRENSFVKNIIFIGILILIFKFSRTEIIQLFAITLAASFLGLLFFNTSFDFGESLANFVIGVMFFVIAYTTERKRQKKFFEQYDFYHKKNQENIRMRRELNYAREIQLSMLPKSEATIGELEIAATSIPATEVGGDYFDYFKISDDEVGIFICDVSGHGVASGLLLSGLRSCMHLILEDTTHPRIVIEKLNRMIRKTQNRKMFVTAILAVIDLRKNKCMLYNAGHLPPYKISGESKEIFKIKKHGVALGAMNIVEASGSNNDVVFDFNKNDKIIFFTDGANEAMNKDKAEYGIDNLENYLNDNSDKKASDLLNGLISDIKNFTKESVQRDDLTMLIVQRN